MSKDWTWVELLGEEANELPIWERMYGIHPDTGELYLPAAIVGLSEQFMMVLFVADDDKDKPKVVLCQEHPYFHADWLAKEFPGAVGLINKVKAFEQRQV